MVDSVRRGALPPPAPSDGGEELRDLGAYLRGIADAMTSVGATPATLAHEADYVRLQPVTIRPLADIMSSIPPASINSSPCSLRPDSVSPTWMNGEGPSGTHLRVRERTEETDSEIGQLYRRSA